MNLATQPFNRGTRPARLTVVLHPETLRKFLLISGIASSLLYVAMDIIGAAAFPGYNSASRAVSELSAIDTPSRPFMLAMGLVYNVLVLAFSVGVWASSAHNRPLRITATLLMIFGVLGFVAPIASMHQRGTQFNYIDTLHITLAMIDVALMFASIAFGSLAFGKKFRWYSIVTVVMLLLFGALTIPYAPLIAANQETPLLGVFERINIGVFMLWIIVLAFRLWNPSSMESRYENA